LKEITEYEKFMKKIKLTKHASQTIKERLKKDGITQEDFAEDYLKVTYRTLQNYLSRKTAIPFVKIDIIQDFFCMNIVDIFGEIPREYKNTTTNIFNIIKLLFQVNIFNSKIQKQPNATKKGFSHYGEKLSKQLHIHPYPIDQPFRILKCNTEIEKNYYCNISIFPECEEIPIGTVFSIGYIAPSSPVRIRFDYGTIIIKEKSFAVDEVFTSVFSRYETPINFENFEKNKCLLRFATWIGEENINFVIRSSGGNFSIKTENFSEEEIYQQESRGMAIFRRGVWQ